MDRIRTCHDEEFDAILGIINAAAEVYRGVIPPEHWHEPYMTERQLRQDIASGVEFHGYEANGDLIGVMGVHSKGSVDIIRHAYVLPECQSRGVGGALLTTLRNRSARPTFIGTWEAATWAIRFYQRNGFRLVDPEAARALLKAYWDVPEDQMAVSVVLEGK